MAEVGEETMAKEALRRAVTLDPENSHAKYITLGQLTSGAESLKFRVSDQLYTGVVQGLLEVGNFI